MSPLLALLAFMLPILTVVTQDTDGSDLYTLFPSGPVYGDILNVTQCYCQSPNPVGPDAAFGYYYLFAYYNYHLDKSYSVTANCVSPSPANPNGTKPAKCIDHVGKLGKLCDDNEDGNKFCFRYKGDPSNLDHSKISASKYTFNHQKRRVPGEPSDIMAHDNVTQNCGFYCKEELGGMVTAPAPQSLIPSVGFVTNSIFSFTDLDDMCYTCA